MKKLSLIVLLMVLSLPAMADNPVNQLGGRMMMPESSQSAPVPNENIPAQTAKPQERDFGSLKMVEPKFICMMNNKFMGSEQIPVEVEGKTYYGCCPMCAGKLKADASLRAGTDPVSGKQVDKASAVIGAAADGAVYYFENEENLNKYGGELAQKTGETPPSAAPGIIDVDKAIADRVLGDPGAPVKLEEFASLTCGHCAGFSKETFGKLKETYIDTGKVYFIYHDFPLNAPALDAAMVARCLPEDKYFSFIKLLFETQDAWAFSGQYKDSLRQNAKLAGMSDEIFDACINNENLKQKLVEHMNELGEKHKITSTPSFVINGTEMISGAQSFSMFEKALASYLNKKKD